MKKVLFGLLLVISFGAFAADVTYTLEGARDRITHINGDVATVAIRNGGFEYSLQSLNVGRNQTTGAAAYQLSFWGLRAKAGLGLVDDSTQRNHAVYLAGVGYTYNINNKFSASVDAGFQNDFQKNVMDHKLTYAAGVDYTLLAKTSVGVGVKRYNGDTHMNSLALNVNTKF